MQSSSFNYNLSLYLLFLFWNSIIWCSESSRTGPGTAIWVSQSPASDNSNITFLNGRIFVYRKISNSWAHQALWRVAPFCVHPDLVLSLPSAHGSGLLIRLSLWSWRVRKSFCHLGFKNILPHIFGSTSLDLYYHSIQLKCYFFLFFSSFIGVKITNNINI